MYPLIQLGPLNLSSGGLVLLLAVFVTFRLSKRIAVKAGHAELVDQLEDRLLPVALGAIVGGRLWYGLFNLAVFGPNPMLFLTLRIADLAWPGALLGGIVAGWLWGKRRGNPSAQLADTVALALPIGQAIASVGLLLSGEAFGLPTELPWGIPLFGASRHPTQLYYAVGALVCWAVLQVMRQWRLPDGGLFMAYLGLQGLLMLLVEALRADSLQLLDGIRVGQLFGLASLLLALWWFRRQLLANTESATG